MIAANQLYEQLLGHVPMGTIDAAWFRYIMHPRFRATPPFSKRLFDIAGAIGDRASLRCRSMLAAAIAIKLGDGGPVFYRQRRVGEHGEEFEVLKLRTMGVDAEADGRRSGHRPTTPRDADRPDPAAHRTSTSSAALERAARRHDPGRAAAGAPGDRQPDRAQLPALHPPPPGEAGDRRLGRARCGYAGSDLGTAWKLCHDLYYVKHRSLLGDALILACGRPTRRRATLLDG